MLCWQLASTSNFGLDRRNTEYAYFHSTGPQYLLHPSKMHLFNPSRWPW